MADAENRRRGRLATVANPAPWHDYRVRWKGALADGTRLTLDYVPDRLVLGPDSLAGYLEGLDAEAWPVLEALVVVALDDLNNEVVPRWVRVAATRRVGALSHHATADDRQPDWDNPGLLSRLEADDP